MIRKAEWWHFLVLSAFFAFISILTSGIADWFFLSLAVILLIIGLILFVVGQFD